MEMKTPRLVTATLLSAVAVTLAACGAGSSSHVVARVTSTTSAPSITTAVPGTGAGPAQSPPAGGIPTTTSPSNALNTQTLDQVAADLGALDNNLNTANSDLNHPQGDS
jgi:hypothetical protein